MLDSSAAYKEGERPLSAMVSKKNIRNIRHWKSY